MIYSSRLSRRTHLPEGGWEANTTFSFYLNVLEQKLDM